MAMRSRNWAPRAIASNAGDAGTGERCVMADLALPRSDTHETCRCSGAPGVPHRGCCAGIPWLTVMEKRVGDGLLAAVIRVHDLVAVLVFVIDDDLSGARAGLAVDVFRHL